MIKPYLAFALQTACHGCRNREDIQVNLDHVCKQIDGAMYISKIEFARDPSCSPQRGRSKTRSLITIPIEPKIVLNFAVNWPMN